MICRPLHTAMQPLLHAFGSTFPHQFHLDGSTMLFIWFVALLHYISYLWRMLRMEFQV